MFTALSQFTILVQIGVCINGANIVHSSDAFMVGKGIIYPVYADCKLLFVGNVSASAHSSAITVNNPFLMVLASSNLLEGVQGHMICTYLF